MYRLFVECNRGYEECNLNFFMKMAENQFYLSDVVDMVIFGICSVFGCSVKRTSQKFNDGENIVECYYLDSGSQQFLLTFEV